MAKVLSAIPKTYEKDGETKTLYNVALQKDDGSQIGATSFSEVKVGDVIPEDRIHPGKREGEWVIWSEKKGGQGKQWVKNDDLIIAQVAFKGMVDLINDGKLAIKDMNSDTCIALSQIIKKTEAAIKVAPSNGAKPLAKPPAAAPLHPSEPSLPPEPPEELFPDEPPAEPLNLTDLALVDWSKETQANFLNTMVKVTLKLGWLPPQTKKWLKDKFNVADSRGITIAMRNNVIKAMVAEVK